jgi:hypothetical protein
MSRGNVSSRLERLEASARSGPSGRCPKCGLAPGERRPLALIDEDHPDKGFGGDPHERCGRCGRPLYTVVRLVYEDAAGVKGGVASYEPL